MKTNTQLRVHPNVESLEARNLLSLNEFALPALGAAPLGITAGPDGVLWFTERDAGQIGRMALDGSMTEFAVTTPGSRPGHITSGPDGALWFTEPGSNQIGRITTDGKMTEYPLPTLASEPEGITAGLDGAVWFTENAVDRIGRIDRAGRLTEYAAPWVRPGGSGFEGIAGGRDGALWFTERSAHAIGRVTKAGAFQEFPLPSEGDPFAITAGPDGNLWFTEQNYTQVGRITLDGKVTEFGGHVLNSFYGDITAGPDGAAWFLVNNTLGGPQLGRIAPDGNETFIVIPTLIPLGDITTGQDGNLWFAEMASNQIGQWVFDAGSGPHSSGDIARANVNKLSPVESAGEARPTLAPTLLPNSTSSDLLGPSTIQAQSSGISHWSLIVGQPGQDNLSGEDILHAL